jgi:hypothetical protein
MAGILQSGVLIARFVAPMSVVSNQPAFISDTISLKRQVSSQNVQRWEIVTRVEPSNSSADFLLHSVINGYDNVVDIQMPQVYRSNDNKTTSTSIISVSANATKGQTTISISNNNGTLAKGEFIKFQNHDKVYLVTSTLASSSGSITIYPRLNFDVSSGTPMLYGSSTILKARYDTNTILGITYEDGILSDPGTIGFIEAL